MYGLKKRSKQDENGLIQGAGTGTSDDIKKNVPAGSYIMPADSTKQIGTNNLKNMGSPTPVNLSNGEFQLSPDQVHSVGVQTLDAMKNQTHVPVDQPQLGFKPGQNKPELFFANGGLVSPYPSADDIRKARAGKNVPSTSHAQEFIGSQQQQQQAGSQARTGQTFNGQARTVNPPPSTAHAQDFVGRQATPQQPGGSLQTRGQTIEGQSRPVSNLPATTTPGAGGGGARTPGFLERAGSKAAGIAKGLGVAHGIGSMIGGAVQGFNTPTEDYATRMGLDPNADRGAVADLGIRTAGVLSDVGNAASFGLLGSRFADKQINQARADAEANLADIARRRAERDAARPAAAIPNESNKARMNIPTERRSIEQDMNNVMYGNPQAVTAQAAPQQSNDPYKIQQNGNSFSYANPQAAAAARAAGIPELQSTGIQGSYDARGVANMMANTRPMGPSQEQIDRAINQSINNGFAVSYPDRPQRNDAQEAERQNVLSQIQAPIKGARGMTSSQRAQLMEMQTGEDQRAMQMYNTDANNATSQLNNTSSNAANIAQTMMREQGSNDRAYMNESGENMRFGMGLNQDRDKFNAEYGLKARSQALTETKEGFGIRNAARVEKLNEMYDKAETDEQRASIQQRINRLTGAKDQSGKDRYMTVGGGQEYNREEGVMINRPQQIFDTKTGRLLNMDGTPAGGPGATVDNSQFDTSKLKDGQVYQAPSTGQYFRWDAKSGRAIPVQQ